MRLYPVTNNNGRWSPDEGEQRCGRCAKTTCVGLSSGVNKRQGRCRAILIQPKAGVAACLAMIPSAYNGTSCPATAASNGGSSERSSEGLDSRWALPGAGSFNRPTVREVVSNRTEQKNFKKYNEGRSISGYSNMLPTKTGAALCFYF